MVEKGSFYKWNYRWKVLHCNRYQWRCDVKTYFDLQLKGRDWWKPYLAYLILYYCLYIPGSVLSKNPETAAASVVFNILTILFFVLVYPVFAVKLYRIFCSKLFFLNKSFEFTGSAGRLVSLAVKGSLLSVVTIGIYFPWFMRNLMRFFYDQTRWDGKPFVFNGKGGTLLKYFLLAFLIPFIVLMVIVVTVTMNGQSMLSAPGLAIAMCSVIIVIFIPLYILMVKWQLCFSYVGYDAAFRVKLVNAAGYFLGQIVLSIVTLGLYIPAAYIKLYRYVANHVLFVHRETGKEYPVGFDGSLARNYGYFLLQFLLLIVTLGLATPWVYARCGSRLANATFVEGVAEQDSIEAPAN